MGTDWEHVGNTGKMKKILGPPKLKRKKSMHFECMLNLPTSWHEISIPKTCWPGLIPPL
jgi:hypothetical protein